MLKGNLQFLFDSALAHIRGQGRLAVGLGGGGTFVNEQGDKCNIAHLMNEDEMREAACHIGEVSELPFIQRMGFEPDGELKAGLLLSLVKAHDFATFGMRLRSEFSPYGHSLVRDAWVPPISQRDMPLEEKAEVQMILYELNMAEVAAHFKLRYLSPMDVADVDLVTLDTQVS